jgi:regulator of nonsense transcripts 2
LSSQKGWRKRTAKILFEVPRSQNALIPFYARFTATVSQYFKDLGQELVNLLEAEFTKLYEDSDVVKIESKVKNIRFLGELTKFGVCSSKVVFECLKKCLDDFNTHNIELTIHLLETCGKFLSRGEPEAVLKFNNLLEILSRLKESKEFKIK